MARGHAAMRAAGVAALARAPARAASTPPSRRRAIARRRARAAATSNDGRRASKRASDEKDDDDDDDDGGGGPPVRAATATAVAAAVAAILASFSSGAPPWDRAMALSAADVGDDAGGGLAGALLARGNGLNGGGSEAWDRRVAEWAVDAFASLSREDQVIVVEKLEKLILSEDDAISRAGTSSSPRRTRPGDVDLTSREAEAEEARAERFVRPPARARRSTPRTSASSSTTKMKPPRSRARTRSTAGDRPRSGRRRRRRSTPPPPAPPPRRRSGTRSSEEASLTRTRTTSSRRPAR